MKYFKNIHSLSELKKQFRTLAIQNHPDKGGDTAVMQEINAEFDALFTIWKNRPDAEVTEEERQESATEYRRRFYTANGWEGVRYDGNLRTTDIAARVRVYAKERYPEYKFSIRSEYFSMGSAIHIKLLSGPVPAFKEDAPRQYINTMSDLSGKWGLTEEVHAVMSDVVAYCNSYNYDDSDGQIDYFDTNFYLHIYVGSCVKPYEVKEPKAKKVSGKTARRADRLQGEAVKSVAPSCADPEAVAVLVVDYSEKAFAVIGDTAPIKDDLKALGGRFNARLTVEGQKVAGWIFSKSKEAAVMEYVRKLNESGEASEPMAEEPAAVPSSEEPRQEAPKGEAVRGRMGCVVCEGKVFYLTSQDWAYQDKNGILCNEDGAPFCWSSKWAAEAMADITSPKRGRFFLHEHEAYKFAEEWAKHQRRPLISSDDYTAVCSILCNHLAAGRYDAARAFIRMELGDSRLTVQQLRYVAYTLAFWKDRALKQGAA